ncbi:precorrin-2 C(20)-methyltransferase [Tenacibaculum jejuense]|uniref:Precorrin-2 C(20)-methyltransferase n=1 Tax=Tenacibaculum jejuense TaxID=584609 RepID=A0A238UBJ0_9FLAO|nr:precorrin-2 C(20)-methyltransferase [Tenacibaculum jejuense]SNR16573.1 Precorrin-2 C(20)-methyltransferase [Tenacibaculum jejuense]
MVYGVALGPGDPELLTIKALRILQESDVIFYPGSTFKGVQKSFVYPLLEYHNLKDKDLRGFYLEMSDNRSQSKRVYETTAFEIQKLAAKGKKVAIVCEGDLSLYASFTYIMEHLQELNVPISLIPGINSFSLGAAKHQIPLSLLNDKIAIVPRVKTIEEITTYFNSVDTLVLMKVKTSWKLFYDQLKAQSWQFYYCERLGTPQEYITTNLQEISEREIPYFSLLIIKNNKTDD